MKREEVEARITELKAQQEQLRFNLVAVDGAIQDCHYWLAKMDAPVVDRAFAEPLVEPMSNQMELPFNDAMDKADH